MKKLFLKWFLINVVTLVIVGIMLWLFHQYAGRLSLAGQIISVVIGLIYLRTAIRAGALSWRADSPSDVQTSTQLIHEADHISFAANECPYLGMMGAVAGMIVVLSTFLITSDASHLQQILGTAFAGAGTAFIPTLLGIFFRGVLTWQHQIITHELRTRILS